MEILERPYGMRAGFAPLDNIGYFTFEVSLEGEVYTYAISNKAEYVGGNKWKIRKYDFLGNPIECVIPRDILVGFAWYNINEKLWQNSTYADTSRRCKEFFSISKLDKAKTIYKTSRGFYYYVTRFGEVYNTEYMTKVKGSIDRDGYRYLKLGSAHHVKAHRLVAHHFVRVSEDLLAQGLVEESLEVNHIDGNKLNNRWDNLEWTTNAGNMAHASINGLMHTTIDDHLLERVWQYLQAGYSTTNISRETGIPASTVNAIRKGTVPRYRTDKYTWPKHSFDVREKERRDELAIKCVQMFNQGISYKDIADKLGFKCRQPVATLISTRRDLITRKIPHKLDKERRDELAIKCVKMFNQGISYKDIADKLGFKSTTSVFTLIGKYRDLITRKLPRKLDKATVFSIYDEFTYTDKKNCELSRKYNVSRQFISNLRRGRYCSNLAREYITSKGLDRYWKGFSPPK